MIIMTTKREKVRMFKLKKDWQEKYNEMRFSFSVLEEAYKKLPWHWIFWKKAKMHSLIKRNSDIYDIAKKELEQHEFNFYDEKNKEFQKNYKLYMKLLNKKRDKIDKKKKEFDMSYQGKEAFKPK